MVTVLLLVIAAVPALYYFPKWQADSYLRVSTTGTRPRLDLDKQYFDVENESRKTLAQIVLGVFGLVAVYLTWMRSRAQDLQARVAEQGLMTDRFTQAIEQLGAVHGDGKPKIEVRLGAIYALERLARDSERDHWTIMEVLCAYVRENAPWVGPAGGDGEAPGKTAAPSRLRTDVQAALTVIGRRERSDSREERAGARLPLDLGGTDLRRAALAKAHLEGASLYQAHLEGVSLDQAHLEGARLYQAHLEGASLYQAHLEGAYLREAHLEGAYLDQAHLEGARLDQAHLEGVSLYQAHLEGASLYQAHLEGAYLDQAHLEGARLGDAHLEGASLGAAHLETFAIVEKAGRPESNKLTAAQVRSAADWESAHWSSEARAALGLALEDRAPTASPATQVDGSGDGTA